MKISSRLILAEDKKNKISQKVTLKLMLPVGEAKNNSVLGPLLGQHQINIMSFCNEFNTKSLLKYNTGVMVPVHVLLGKDRTYTLNIRFPTLSFFFEQLIELDKFTKKIQFSKFYDIVRIFSFFLDKDEKSVLYMCLGYLTSGNKKYTYKFVE